MRRAAALAAVALALALVPVRAGAAEAPRAGAGVRWLYLVRHGAYTPDRNADERTANGLNALGRAQAARIGERLAHLPVRTTSLVSSELLRAKETADIVGRALGMTPARDSLLNECSPPSDRPRQAMGQEDADAARSTAQLEAAWAKYAKASPDADARDVLVCHGNVIRWFVARALGLDLSHWSSLDIGNASLTVIAVQPDGRTRLVTFSDVGHLPVDEQTWTGHGAGWGGAPAR